MDLMILDTNLKAVKVFDTYKSLVWTERYNTAGDFEIYTNVTDDNIKYLKQDYYVTNSKSEKVMIIEELNTTSDVEEGNDFIVTGRSLESILERRIIWNQTVLTGNLQDGIQKLLNDAIINPSDSSRKIPNFEFRKSEDSRITSLTVDGQYTGDNLYEVICNLCEINHIGFRIDLSFEDGKFTFYLYVGEDRSYEQSKNPYVVFSPTFDNLIGSNYLESKKAYKSVTLVAGEGEGSERKTTTVYDNSSLVGLDRREMYTDARDISQTVDNKKISESEYLTQLSQRGKEELAENKLIKSFEGEVDANISYKYGIDYFMGDIVQLTNEYGIESRSRVIELIRSESSDAVDVYPTFENIDEEKKTQ